MLFQHLALLHTLVLRRLKQLLNAGQLCLELLYRHADFLLLALASYEGVSQLVAELSLLLLVDLVVDSNGLLALESHELDAAVALDHLPVQP